MKNKIFILIVFLGLINLSISCDSADGNTIFYELNIVFNQKLNKAKLNKALPNNLLQLLDYTKIVDESKECFGKYYIPRISFYRTDLDKTEKIEFPIAEMPIVMESIITPDELDNNYDTSRIKTPKVLTIATQEDVEVDVEVDENTYALNIYKDSKENIDSIKSQITEALCGGATSIRIIINDKKGGQGHIKTGGVISKEDGAIVETTEVGPCNNPSLVELMPLREELLQVINTSSSMSERAVLAEQIWNKYFDSDAYVASYQNREDKNPEVWEPGEGREYFISRIAILKSITDITIFRAEYSKINKKITGIKLIECHNASQLQ